jgi:hypothetical protein
MTLSTEYQPFTAKAKPRPLITVRNLRAHFSAVVKAGEVRCTGDHRTVRCIIIPVPPSEWHRKQGLDLRMRETRRLFEEFMAILER